MSVLVCVDMYVCLYVVSCTCLHVSMYPYIACLCVYMCVVIVVVAVVVIVGGGGSVLVDSHLSNFLRNCCDNRRRLFLCLFCHVGDFSPLASLPACLPASGYDPW